MMLILCRCSMCSFKRLLLRRKHLHSFASFYVSSYSVSI